MTRPVQPHTKEELAALSFEGKGNSSTTGVSEVKQKGPESDESVEVINDSNNSSNSKTTSPKAATKPAVASGEKQQQHSRWLHGSNADEVEEARRRSEELAKEVRESAEKAKAMAIAAGGSLAPVVATTQSKPSSITPSSPPGVADEDGTFMPCATFSGRRVGYVFKKGVKGMGYYLDTVTVASNTTGKTKAQTVGTASSSSPTQTSTVQKTATVTPTPTNASVAGSESDALPLAFPFEYRQTPSSIAVLVQVPGIVADSAKVIFRATSVEVSFQAAAAAAAAASKANSNDGDSNNNSNHLTTYNLKLVVHGGFLELPRCKYDVAAKNMVLALAKREEGLWIESVDQPIVSAEPLTIQTKDKAVGNAPACVSPKATLIKSMVSNENKKIDNQNLADQLNSMKLSSAPAVFDLD